MGNNFRTLSTACIVGFLILSVLAVSLVQAENSSIPKPSVPAFTAKFIDNSYTVSASTSVDPYNGQTINHPSYRVENYTIRLEVENQPYSPISVYEGTSNWTANFYYNVRMKGHFENDWMNLYNPDTDYPKKSDCQYTVISYSTRGDNGIDIGGRTLVADSEDQIDFQVEAMIGYVSRHYNASATTQLEMFPWEFTGQESGWSNTQTVTITGNVATATPNTSSSSTQAIPTVNTGPIVSTYWGFNFGEVIIVVILAVVALLLAILIVVVRGRKEK